MTLEFHTDTDDSTRYREVVAAALAALDLDAKTRLLAGQDLWSLPALPEIGLASLVMSDGPVGVRGGGWSSDDPALTLPSPTALAATWDPELARRAGRVLAQEAHRKGVHMLLAPTINLHRSPLAGRHFEAYSEDPLLTARIGAGYVTGVQEHGVAATIKHFVANDAETQRFTVDNRVSARALRELYLAPFEEIIAAANPWALMSAYNSVNGATMTEHHALQVGVLREEWGYDGVVVSDWLAARDTVGGIEGGLDVEMPGPASVFGPVLAAAVRAGTVAESTVDTAVRHVLLLAARLGLLRGAAPIVPPEQRPAPLDGIAVAHEVAARSIVLLRNDNRALPLEPAATGSIALIGHAARDARILGGGSATVFPERVISPLDGLRAALPAETSITYAAGAELGEQLAVVQTGFELRAVLRDAVGGVLAEQPLVLGRVRWLAAGLPDGVHYDALDSVELTGTFTPRESGKHEFGLGGAGEFELVVDGQVLPGRREESTGDPFEAIMGRPCLAGVVDLVAGRSVEVVLRNSAPKVGLGPIRGVSFSLAMAEPRHDPEELLQQAVAAAATAEVAVVVVATTATQESEGFDRTDLRLPGRQDELVSRVAAVNPRTIVVVNSGSPVEMPWREEVSAVLLTWFPGQEGGAALADVLLGHREPGGRLPTTWPATLADAPVFEVTPTDGMLCYDEEVRIGYRAWHGHDAEPAYPFGHGLGYTDWGYEALEVSGRTVRIRVRNNGSRPGRETVQVYLESMAADPAHPVLRLAGFAQAVADPGECAEVRIVLSDRAFRYWDESMRRWSPVPGEFRVHAGRSSADLALSAAVAIAG